MFPQSRMSFIMLPVLCLFMAVTPGFGHIGIVGAEEIQRPSPGRAYLEEGKREMDRGTYARAIRLFSAAIKSGANAYKLRARAYFLSGEREKALADIDRYLLAHRSDPAGHLLRGDVALSLGNPEGALSDYRAAVKLDPSSAEAYVSRGLAYLALERYSSAVRDFQAALRIDPRNLNALSNLGVAHMLANRPHAARTCFDRAMRIETHPRWRKTIARWLARLPREADSGPDPDLPVEDDCKAGESTESGKEGMAGNRESPNPVVSPSQPVQSTPRLGVRWISPRTLRPRTKGTHLSGKWETTYHGARITLDVSHSGSSLSGVMHIRSPFGQDSTYHFTGSTGFDGSIRAAHHSGHAFEGRFTKDGRIDGTVTTRFGTKLPINLAPH